MGARGTSSNSDLKTAAAEALRVSDEDCARVDALNRAAVSARRSPEGDGDHTPSFFEAFALQGIRVESIHPGHILCSFTVPTRLTAAAADNHHHLAPGAVVALVDEIGSAAAVADGQHLKVSVDMSVSFVDLAAAAPGDTLRITARVLGHKGYYSGTHVLVANAATGEVVAEGRHSLFGKMKVNPPPPTPTTFIKSNI
uniref:Acyl-coenzyme A thioesterase 13 n=1 Tax=Arundo donax TaxID=35708 RepID=A0A0A9GA59_ARUDO